MSKSLLIVESPTKAKTLERYLGKDFIVKASVGHVKDLPGNRLGINLDEEFKPEYQVMRGKKKILEELKKAASRADAVYLGPDPDREGEAIAWHIAEEIGVTDKPVRRVLFYELTRKAIAEAIGKPNQLNRKLYEAQQARRILDRLVGYMISPLLWEKVRAGLSAGRVQSVALRLICEREEEIHGFEQQEYWTIEARLSPLPRFIFRSNALFCPVDPVQKEKVRYRLPGRGRAPRAGAQVGPLPRERESKESKGIEARPLLLLPARSSRTPPADFTIRPNRQ